MRTMMLPLRGTADFIRGFEATQRSCVYRLRSLGIQTKVNPSVDMFVTHDESYLSKAAQAGFNSALVIGNKAVSEGAIPSSMHGVMTLSSKFEYLKEGDVIAVEPGSRKFRALYRHASKHNSFLVTDRCNHYCLMCSQPPKNVNDRWILDEIRSSIPLIDPETHSIAFTGGEPLLDWPEFIQVLGLCRDHLPRTAIHVLSNGRAFVHNEVVNAWVETNHPNLTVGIPIYSAIDHLHDYIVQARGAFDETVLGILKLKNKKQRVEIRVVLHSLTAPRIVEICRWISRNLPFVDHVALMGLENVGFAIANELQLWIDPIDYQKDLAKAVDLLASARIKVSVYNLQRCILPRSIWPYAVKSISDWKNEFVAECEHCIEKPRCSGFFSSGRPRRSRAISPILR
jgi:His-Xaa-Ser system radical SAM maturase HxsC